MSRSPLPSHRDLLLTVFGLYGRGSEGWIPIAHLVQLISAVGAEPSAVRASVSRLLKKGTLVNRQKNGRSEYSLAHDLKGAFSAGDQRIFAPRQASMEDPWLLATFTLSETQRNVRHHVRSGLTKLGFGTVSPGLWIAPIHVELEALEYFRRHSLDEHILFFRAELAGGKEPRAAWWNLGLLEERYARFVEDYAELVEGPVEGETAPREAFALYILLLTNWRGLPYLDPGLPPEMLPTPWHGGQAHHVFLTLHEALGRKAAEYAHTVLGQ